MSDALSFSGEESDRNNSNSKSSLACHARRLQRLLCHGDEISYSELSRAASHLLRVRDALLSGERLCTESAMQLLCSGVGVFRRSFLVGSCVEDAEKEDGMTFSEMADLIFLLIVIADARSGEKARACGEAKKTVEAATMTPVWDAMRTARRKGKKRKRRQSKRGERGRRRPRQFRKPVALGELSSRGGRDRRGPDVGRGGKGGGRRGGSALLEQSPRRTGGRLLCLHSNRFGSAFSTERRRVSPDRDRILQVLNPAPAVQNPLLGVFLVFSQGSGLFD